MSDTKGFPAAGMLLSFGLGAMAAAGSLAICGWLMVGRGLTQDAAGPLATLAVCLGSFFSGVVMAALQKEKGLIWGAAEGLLFAAVLIILSIVYQREWQLSQVIRAVSVLTAGILGGILGALRPKRRRR